ncbi:rod shape-determining protein MreC [Streptococcus sp. S784/96/1]|uniref:rod shape-determining protein MreC n=1 Tax=Streptococcus sp. S784/96/1 TaxID=2653499 RepID=UPI00138A6B99|nr:rod shape-determining protein MreC [Streptococcus sp. S784/96/1]
MRKLGFSRFLLICVVTVTCVASLIFFLLKEVRIRQSISQYISNISLTVSSAMSYPLSSAKNFLSDFNSVDELRKENSKLNEKLSILEPNEKKLKDLISENESLRASLDIKNSFASQTVLTGKVINRSTLAWLDWISLDVGHEDGVLENMLVLSNGYLIGKITQVTSKFSTVDLLTNTGKSIEIPIKISTSTGDIYGILTGFDVHKNSYLITKLNKKLDITKGNPVFTSGLDGQTVANVKVGEVVEIISEDELNRTVYVSPGANFDDLAYVTLIGE